MGDESRPSAVEITTKQFFPQFKNPIYFSVSTIGVQGGCRNCESDGYSKCLHRAGKALILIGTQYSDRYYEADSNKYYPDGNRQPSPLWHDVSMSVALRHLHLGPMKPVGLQNPVTAVELRF